MSQFSPNTVLKRFVSEVEMFKLLVAVVKYKLITEMPPTKMKKKPTKRQTDF